MVSDQAYQYVKTAKLNNILCDIVGSNVEEFTHEILQVIKEISSKLISVEFYENSDMNNNQWGALLFHEGEADYRLKINTFLHSRNDYVHLIWTIAHELAHIWIFEHNETHNKYTNYISKIIIFRYAIKEGRNKN